MKNDVLGQFGMVILAAACIGVFGCGGDTMRSTAAPTATPASTAAVSESHHGGGNNGGGNGDNNGGNSGNNSNQEVEISGTAQAVTGACPALRLTIAGRIVSTTASTEFKDVSCAGLTAGQTVEVKGTLQSDGSVAATRVEVDANDRNENEGEVNGAIAASIGACPTLTLTVGTMTVKTNAATLFHDAACGTFSVGSVIEAKGTRQADGTLLASRIEREGVE